MSEISKANKGKRDPRKVTAIEILFVTAIVIVLSIGIFHLVNAYSSLVEANRKVKQSKVDKESLMTQYYKSMPSMTPTTQKEIKMTKLIINYTLHLPSKDRNNPFIKEEGSAIQTYTKKEAISDDSILEDIALKNKVDREQITITNITKL